MISRERAKELVESFGREYELRPYPELERLADENQGVPAKVTIQVDDSEIGLQPNIGRIGDH